ncbi:MAG: Crp/Fnr family transcriptional regulator [Bacillota bacterium]|nr:Crp/Fnr family transcriptional regulator [Bacillota bacterium]
MAYIKEYLSNNDIFKDIDPTLAAELHNKLIMRKYKKKVLIFMEGEPADFIYFILQGKVKLSKLSDHGQEKIVQIIQSGQFFGEIPALDGGAHPLTAETIEEAEIGLLSILEFNAYLRENPQLAYGMMEIMAKRMRQAFRQIKNLALKNTHSRLAIRLYKLSREYGVEMGEGVFIRATFTHQELANMIGTSRETVSRILREFEKSGILKVVRQKITIINMEKLKESF